MIYFVWLSNIAGTTGNPTNLINPDTNLKFRLRLTQSYKIDLYCERYLLIINIFVHGISSNVKH
jgi:hypothetical protein